MKDKKKIMLLVITIIAISLAVVANRYLPGVGATTGPSDVQVRTDEKNAGKQSEVAEKDANGSDHKHGEDKFLHLSEDRIKELGIEVQTAGPGNLDILLRFPGEVVLNADRTAQIVPRLTGVVSEVRKNLGDAVNAGEVMAVIESRELAEAKAKYLAALSRMELAQTNFTRFESLWQKEVIPEKQFLEVKAAFQEAQIELRSTKQKLHAMGFSSQFLKNLPDHPDQSLTRYEILAPFDGTVISKRITLGEMRKEDYEAFLVSDLSSVWVNLNVSQKELSKVKEGQRVTVSTGNGIPDAEGKIAYIEPVVGNKTRSAVARVVLPNPERQWRPGLFVTAKVTVDSKEVALMLPKAAVQTLEGKPVVFVREGEEFEPKPVKIGLSNGSRVEILSGLRAGDQYAAKQTFVLKAELGKSEARHED